MYLCFINTIYHFPDREPPKDKRRLLLQETAFVKSSLSLFSISAHDYPIVGQCLVSCHGS